MMAWHIIVLTQKTTGGIGVLQVLGKLLGIGIIIILVVYVSIHVFITGGQQKGCILR